MKFIRIYENNEVVGLLPVDYFTGFFITKFIDGDDISYYVEGVSEGKKLSFPLTRIHVCRDKVEYELLVLMDELNK
jgi:hypothetical protein